ncbi:uncharacterized protein M421DRAFT_2717 [Didymella exigua CBS 183.55]|uniref:PAT1 multi-domain protein n=1 Tax=Didymella exigua CBS 183.55 TaxID=1150837 RepID=A0A6A5RRZ3_9PLEO|nr:uncharacterized protein M421DRAFT_2717 [Didymella exigua CBS 183.55]KAF1931201.1 hypothetical protein M421DRAFT_2717 [Didymella exigua CBS 183.55]
MIFGGLEVIAGGYFAHKYYKNKNEKKRLEDEAQHRRNNTFPSNGLSTYPLKPQFQHQEQRLQHRPQQTTPPQKYACHAPTPPRPQCQGRPRPQQVRPKPSHTQSFTIQRRPVPQRKPDIIVQPSLQRADSMATLSRMPIANGYRPSNQAGQNSPPRYQTSGLSPIQQSPYGNAAFSISSPAFGATPTSPPVSYVTAPEGGRHTTEDNWETYEHQAHRYSAYAPTEASTQLGEQEPPPPYAP